MTLGVDYVAARAGTGRYAVAMSDVAEVGRPPDVTRVPGLPSFVAGLANWRGGALTVLDARILLDARRLLAAAPLGRAGRLIVLTRDDVRFGLLVDAVEGVFVATNELGQLPATVPVAVGGLLAGSLLDADGTPVGVLDVGALLQLRGQLALR